LFAYDFGSFWHVMTTRQLEFTQWKMKELVVNLVHAMEEIGAA
jgi:hypothetical protein